jgi:hypothetical protein
MGGEEKTEKKIHANKKGLKKITCKQTCLKKNYKQNNNYIPGVPKKTCAV